MRKWVDTKNKGTFPLRCHLIPQFSISSPGLKGDEIKQVLTDLYKGNIEAHFSSIGIRFRQFLMPNG